MSFHYKSETINWIHKCKRENLYYTAKALITTYFPFYIHMVFIL